MRILIVVFIGLCSNMLLSADYYWVGGSGTWSDISHWAAASGGSVKFPTVPTSEDNVIFDENSFTGPNQTVSIQGDIIFVNSVDWTGVTNMPRFMSSKSSTIKVFGDFLLSSDMILEVEGKILFTGIAGEKRIDLNGHILRGAMTFEGESTWGIESALAIDSMLEIKRGKVHMNGNPLTCRFFHMNTDGDKMVDIRNSNIVISGAYQDEYAYDGDGSISFYIQNNNLELLAGGSTITLSAENASLYHLGGRDDLYLEEVNFTANSGKNYLTSEWYEEAISFGSLSFNSDALIEGSINAETLTLGSGGRYRFGAEKSYIFGLINAAGDCTEGVVISSDNPGFASDFQVSSGTVNMDFVTLRDIHIVASPLLSPNNATDLGNNQGWDFSNSSAVDFFWIGGSGNWNDPTHWSFTSGGLSSACVPSGKDNAHFDINSFTGPNQSVSLNSNATFVHDLLWLDVIGNPEFTGNPMQRIVVTGSLELANNMEHDVEGFYDFESNEDNNTILLNGNIFNESVTFSGILGQWTFLDDVEVYRTTYLRSGRLNLNGFQLTTTRFNSNTGLPRIMDIENSMILLRESLYLGPEWTVDLENYEVNAGNSTISMTSNGNFDHSGYGSTTMPRYNRLVFDNLNSGIRSVNNNTDESIPAVYFEEVSFTARGRLSGSNQIGSLNLADGFSYLFDASNNRKQVIDDLILKGSCESGLTQLYSSEPGNQANIALPGSLVLERVQFQDINIIQGSLLNNNSIDGGNNTNMTFNEVERRTLFWVGNAGQWQDPAHWSRSSGGVGGECIPTNIDDVIFDQNSFNIDGQRLTSIPSATAQCNNLLITELFGRPEIDLDLLSVSRSLTYDASFINYVDELIFIGSQAGEVITGGQEMRDIRFRKDGEISFSDNFLFSRWTHESGTVYFGSNDILGRNMYFYGGALKQLNLENSRTFLTDEGDAFNDRGSNLLVNPGKSQIFLSGEEVGIFSRAGLSFNKVHFTNAQGLGYLASRFNWDNGDLDGFMNVKAIEFNGNGRTFGHVNADSLLGVAGKVYVLDSERKLSTANYFQLRGNNCTPIELRSSVNSLKAEIEMPIGGEVVVDFVQMKDIRAFGGAFFNAGSRSVDISGSNEGWIFQDAPDFVETGFLGLDRAICRDEPVVLEAYSYSPNETYQWSDGSTDSTLLIDEAGTYFVEVQFESNCVLRDTILIIDSEVVEANLPDEQFICAEGSVQLDATVGFDGANYSWNTGAVDSVLEVEEAGWYFVDVEALGCITSDSVNVGIIQDPGSVLPSDSSVCAASQIVLMPNVEGAEYLWSDGSTNDIFEGLVEEEIWLELLLETCSFRDSISFDIRPVPAIDLPRDSSICDNSSLLINLPERYTYLWMDGSITNTYEIREEGEYILQTQNEGCRRLDTIMITIRPSPDFTLGEDLEVCESEEVNLILPGVFDSYQWSNGSSESSIYIQNSGIYWLQAEEEGCLARDSIEVSFIPLPLIDLGLDTTVCEDEAYQVIPVEMSFGDLIWQDGSTTETFEVLSPGLISARLFDGFCENADSIYIDFRDCVYFDIFVPNAFSPNGDGYNDKFEVFFPENLIVNEYSIAIYSRWGDLVFEESDLSASWDGTFNTDQLSSGVYVYIISVSYVDENGPDEILVKGDVAIIR